MAGKIIVSTLQSDTDNSISFVANTGATIFSANISHGIAGSFIANGSITGAKIALGTITGDDIATGVTLTTPIISGNLNLDSTGTTGIRAPAANTLAFYTAGTEDMRIDASGNVGIGISSSTARLCIPVPEYTSSFTSGMIRFQNPNVAADGCIQSYYVSGSGMDFFIGSNAYIDASGVTNRFSNSYASSAINIRRDGEIGFQTNTSAGVAQVRMVINSAGDVGIGTGSPSQKLHVDGGSGMTSSALIARFFGTSGNSLLIRGSGNCENTNGSFGAISDAKLKENIVDATPKLDKVNQLKVRNYNLIGDELKQIGFVAQEIEQVFPGIVSNIPDVDAEGNDLGTTTKTVKTTVLIPILVKAIQEQQAIISDLKTRIEALEAQ
jgi:hypothetical protein